MGQVLRKGNCKNISKNGKKNKLAAGGTKDLKPEA
jgi:hypothetical protein